MLKKEISKNSPINTRVSIPVIAHAPVIAQLTTIHYYLITRSDLTKLFTAFKTPLLELFVPYKRCPS